MRKAIRFIIYFLFLGLIVPACDMLDKHNPDGEYKAIHKGVHFKIMDHRKQNDPETGGESGMGIKMKTGDIYRCYNYDIVSNASQEGESLYVNVFGASLSSNVCLTALGPARREHILEQINPGRYELIFYYKKKVDRFDLTVHDTSFVVEGNGAFFTLESS